MFEMNLHWRVGEDFISQFQISNKNYAKFVDHRLRQKNSARALRATSRLLCVLPPGERLLSLDGPAPAARPSVTSVSDDRLRADYLRYCAFVPERLPLRLGGAVDDYLSYRCIVESSGAVLGMNLCVKPMKIALNSNGDSAGTRPSCETALCIHDFLYIA